MEADAVEKMARLYLLDSVEDADPIAVLGAARSVSPKERRLLSASPARGAVVCPWCGGRLLS